MSRRKREGRKAIRGREKVEEWRRWMAQEVQMEGERMVNGVGAERGHKKMEREGETESGEEKS